MDQILDLNTKRVLTTYVNVLSSQRFYVVLGDEKILQKLLAIRLEDAVLAESCATFGNVQEMSAEIDGRLCKI